MDPSPGYPIAAIRQLLLDAFTPEELRRFCADRPLFAPVVDRFGPNHGLDDMVDEVLTYCQKRLLCPDLLDAIRTAHPEQYARFASGAHGSAGSDAVPLPPGDRAPLGRGPGSPFVVGRPLRPGEPIFGRDDVFRFLAGQLAAFSSANIVGERRMGKTSLLNHLRGRQDELLFPQPGQPPLLLACLDLQGGVTSDTRFYGAALRELLDRLPPSRSAEAQDLQTWRQRLHERPEMSYDELQGLLRRLRDARGISVRPVLMVDEFEQLLAPEAQQEFPIPAFFNGLRALITADLLAFVVASRRPLADYFLDPGRPGSLTSTFPTYCTPFQLSLLDEAAADALLLQPGDHTLTLQQAAAAKDWAGGHPCHLQAAGQAWYEALDAGRDPDWARQRFEELKRQNCMIAREKTTARRRAWLGWLGRGLRAVFWSLPLSIGRLAQRLGARLDDIGAWILGAALILVLALVLLGLATGGDVLDALRKALGF